MIKDDATGSETPVELTGSEIGLKIGKQLIDNLCQEDGGYGRGGGGGSWGSDTVTIDISNNYIGRIIGMHLCLLIYAISS